MPIYNICPTYCWNKYLTKFWEENVARRRIVLNDSATTSQVRARQFFSTRERSYVISIRRINNKPSQTGFQTHSFQIQNILKTSQRTRKIVLIRQKSAYIHVTLKVNLQQFFAKDRKMRKGYHLIFSFEETQKYFFR